MRLDNFSPTHRVRPKQTSESSSSSDLVRKEGVQTSRREPSQRIKPPKPPKQNLSPESIRLKADHLRIEQAKIKAQEIQDKNAKRKAQEIKERTAERENDARRIAQDKTKVLGPQEKLMQKMEENKRAEEVKLQAKKLVIPVGENPKGNVLANNSPGAGEVQEKLKTALTQGVHKFDAKTTAVLDQILAKN